MGSKKYEKRYKIVLKIVPPLKTQKFIPLHKIDKFANRISFCVYGEKLKYIVGAIHNAVLAPKIYPGWICRFYIERKTQLIKVLTDLNAEVFVTEDPINFEYGQIHPVTWRFFAIEDELVDRVIFRDTDSRVTMREVNAVKAWIESGKSFHRMKEKDHLNDPPIMSGGWGAKAEKLRNMSQLLCEYREWPHPNQPFPGDFHFLEKKIWPIIKNDCVYHGVGDDKYGTALPFPDHEPIEYGFVGARVEDDKWGM